MQQFGYLLPFVNGLLKTYKILLLIGVVVLSMNSLNSLQAQTPDPVQAIRHLKEGFLLVRFPAFKAKIDTLQAMISRSGDNSTLPRLQKLLNEAIQERDSLFSDYTKAFKDVYHFSKVAYYFDYEGRDLRTAHFYHLDGTLMSKEEMGLNPVFYLHFERTEESHIDAMVIYDMNGQVIPAPFPNNFTRGGINFLFLKISEKKFPVWRVGKINKRLFKYLRNVGGEY